MEQVAKQLFFNDGFVFDRDFVLIAAQFTLYPEDDLSRVCLVSDPSKTPNGDWQYSDYEDAALSVTCLPDNIGFFLGKSGTILIMDSKGIFEERIADTETYGDLLRIRRIGKTVYVCGMSGQIYVRGSRGFVHMDDGILGKAGLDFEDIDGSGPDDIYAVGMGGRIFHYNGNVWRQIDSPTNRPLSNVRCISKEEVYICGNHGHLYRGSFDSWQSLGDDQMDTNFYGLEVFQGNVYVAHPGGIMVHDGSSLSDIDFGLGRKVGCHRLHSADGVLWSFGIHDLMFFDGLTWTYVTCPENV
jgi:hypothetical protein